MKVLIIGATGYLGSAIARKFLANGKQVYGFSRNKDNNAQLEAVGITPIEGDLTNLGQLKIIVSSFDVVILAAMLSLENEFETVPSIIEGCRNGGGHFLFTSGTGVLGIESKDGHWSDYSFAEDDPFPFPVKYPRDIRLKTEELVRSASNNGLHTTVIRPPLIYGHGGSVQIPLIFESVHKTGQACYIGQGLNLYSNVHVDDVAEVFRLAVEKGTSGALYHAVAGEANFRTIAEAVANVTGCKTRSIDFEEACKIWNPLVVSVALAVNSRSVSRRTSNELNWQPEHIDLIEDIRSGSYRERFYPTQS